MAPRGLPAFLFWATAVAASHPALTPALQAKPHGHRRGSRPSEADTSRTDRSAAHRCIEHRLRGLRAFGPRPTLEHSTRALTACFDEALHLPQATTGKRAKAAFTNWLIYDDTLWFTSALAHCVWHPCLTSSRRLPPSEAYEDGLYSEVYPITARLNVPHGGGIVD